MLVYFKMGLVGQACNSQLLRNLRQEELKFKSLAELQSEFSAGLGNSVRSSLRIEDEKRTGEVAQHQNDCLACVGPWVQSLILRTKTNQQFGV